MVGACFVWSPALAQKVKRHPKAVIDTLITNIDGQGHQLQLTFVPGPEHNYPLFAFWLEDLDGNYIQTLYVSQSIAKGTFNYGDKSSGFWKAGEIERPAALPYWAHKRNVENEKGSIVPTILNPVVDAYSGATPPAAFVLETRSDTVLNGKFRLMAEINQSWDWNKHWTNNKYPGDVDYVSSAQPAVVYETIVDPEKPGAYELKLIGRSHHSGKTGELFTDLETLTTALKIAERISVVVR